MYINSSTFLWNVQKFRGGEKLPRARTDSKTRMKI